MTSRLVSAHDEAEASPGLLLWQVTNRWQAAIRKTLKDFGLTHVQFVLLASLTWMNADGPVTQRALADHAATDPMMTSQVLRTLERLDYVRRAAHPVDKRAWSLTVTPAGAALANRANAAVEACDEAFFAGLGNLRGAFTDGLRRLGPAGAPAV